MERLVDTAFYALLVLLMFWRVRRTNSAVLKKLAAWVVVLFIAANMVFEIVGPRHEPYLVAPIRAVVALAVARIGIKHSSYTAWGLAVILGLEAIITFVAIINGTVGQPLFYATLNVLFILSLALIGIIGAGYAMVDRPDGSGGLYARDALGRDSG